MKLNLKVIQKKTLYIAISAILVLASLFFFFVIKLNLGVDFKGGDLLQLQFSQAVDKNKFESSLNEIQNEVPQLKSKRVQFSEDNTVVLRTEQMNEAQKDKVIAKLDEKVGKSQVLKYDTVGPTIGKELTKNALTALIIGSILIIIYVTIRFEFIYAIAGLAALLHDIIITVGAIAFLKYEVDTAFIAAILTILGYSINDTIVVFDRIRENEKNNKDKDFATVIEESVNQVFVRSIYTSVTTTIAIVVLLIFGGASLRTFNMTLFIGMIVGTYSSVFLASPLVYLMRKYKRKNKNNSGNTKKRSKTINGYSEEDKVLV